MTKTPAAKPRRPKVDRVDRVDRVKDLAAGIRRGLSESGWSERGLALAAGLKADRLRNVGRGLSSTLPAEVLARVADVLAIPVAALIGMEPWPDGGARLKRSEPPEEPQAAAPVPGSMVELAAEARRVALEARAAVRVAVAAAEAAERLAGWAEAAAVVPPETIEETFERWVTEAEAEARARPMLLPPATPPAPHAGSLPPAKAAPEEPSQPTPAKSSKVSSEPKEVLWRVHHFPGTQVRIELSRVHKTGRPPRDPPRQLVWYLGDNPHRVERDRKRVVLSHSLRRGKKITTFDCVAIEVVEGGKVRIVDLEDGDKVVGSSLMDKAELIVWIALDFQSHAQSRGSMRAQYPQGCEYIQTRGGGFWAEFTSASCVEEILRLGVDAILAGLLRGYDRLQGLSAPGGRPEISVEIDQMAKSAKVAFELEIQQSGGNPLPGDARGRVIRAARDVVATMRGHLGLLRGQALDDHIGNAAVLECAADRLTELWDETGVTTKRTAGKAKPSKPP